MELATRSPALAPRTAAEPLDLAALVGPEAWARLPQAVQRRFAAAHHDTTYRGSLDLHCSAVGRFFAAFSAVFGGPLTTLRADGVPAEVRVHGNDRGGVVWERRLHAADLRIVRSTKEAGRGGGLVERTDGGLAMDLEVFEEDGALVFRSHRYFLALGRVRLTIPTWMTPGTCRVEHRDLGAGQFRFTLSMVHPWWGRTFEQTGVFADAHEELA